MLCATRRSGSVASRCGSRTTTSWSTTRTRTYQLFKLIADLLRHEGTITYAELKAVVARLKVKAGHFLTQIDVPCAYDFYSTFEPSIDKEFKYYMTGKHQLCVFWDTEKNRSASLLRDCPRFMYSRPDVYPPQC